MMTKKKLWLCWLYLYILCAVLGFIPSPTGVAKGLLMVPALAFFVPGFWLVYQAKACGDRDTVKYVLWTAIGALSVTVLLIIANIGSTLLSDAWGIVLYFMLVVLGSPLICGQVWVITLFLWACLLFYSLSALRKAQ